MSGNARRVLVAGLAAALTFAALWWGTAGFGWLRHDRPVERVLAGQPELLSYRTTWTRDGLQVTVVPVPGVDLPTLYASLREQIAAVLPNRAFTLQVEDRRDATLREAMRVMRLYLEEALANGRFSWADQQVREIAARQGLDWARVAVDTNYLYVELRRGPSYLYEVLPRSRPHTTE